MHLNPERSRVFLQKEYGIKMGESTLRRYKQRLKEQAKQRLYAIAEYGAVEEHSEAIDEIEIARRLLWKSYEEAQQPLTKAVILEKIINTRPLLSSYYDSTKEVIEQPANTQEDNNIQIATERIKAATNDDWV
jgi:hypothetical protein